MCVCVCIQYILTYRANTRLNKYFCDGARIVNASNPYAASTVQYLYVVLYISRVV